MKTKIITPDALEAAARLIRRGEVVAFPSETVWGLGASAFDSSAVKKIFVAKGRPVDNPLIVHIARKSDLKPLVSSVPSYARLFIQHFWPGPLTLILPKSSIVPKVVTAGLDSVAVRFPSHRTAQLLIRLVGAPIAAPSANISSRPSGTSFGDVLCDFDGRIAGVVKSRSSSIGLESTVVDCTGVVPVVLRPGSVTLQQLRSVVPVTKFYQYKRSVRSPRSPGLKYKHYAPNAQVVLFEKSAHSRLSSFKSRLVSQKKRVVVLSLESTLRCSRNLFSFFRSADRKNVDVILVKSIADRGLGRALMNRVRKAASRIVL